MRDHGPNRLALEVQIDEARDAQRAAEGRVAELQASRHHAIAAQAARDPGEEPALDELRRIDEDVAEAKRAAAVATSRVQHLEARRAAADRADAQIRATEIGQKLEAAAARAQRGLVRFRKAIEELEAAALEGFDSQFVRETRELVGEARQLFNAYRIAVPTPAIAYPRGWHEGRRLRDTKARIDEHLGLAEKLIDPLGLGQPD